MGNGGRQGCGPSCNESPGKGGTAQDAYQVPSTASGCGAACGNAEMSGGNKKQTHSMRPSFHSPHRALPCKPSRETRREGSLPGGLRALSRPLLLLKGNPHAAPTTLGFATRLCPRERLQLHEDTSVNTIPLWPNCPQKHVVKQTGYFFLDMWARPSAQRQKQPFKVLLLSPSD